MEIYGATANQVEAREVKPWVLIYNLKGETRVHMDRKIHLLGLASAPRDMAPLPAYLKPPGSDESENGEDSRETRTLPGEC